MRATPPLGLASRGSPTGPLAHLRLQDARLVAGSSVGDDAAAFSGLSALSQAAGIASVELVDSSVVLERRHAVTDRSNGDLYWVLDVPPLRSLRSLTWSFDLEMDDATAAAARAYVSSQDLTPEHDDDKYDSDASVSSANSEDAPAPPSAGSGAARSGDDDRDEDEEDGSSDENDSDFYPETESDDSDDSDATTASESCSDTSDSGSDASEARPAPRLFLLIRFGVCPNLTTFSITAGCRAADCLSGIALVGAPPSAAVAVAATVPYGGAGAPSAPLPAIFAHGLELPAPALPMSSAGLSVAGLPKPTAPPPVHLLALGHADVYGEDSEPADSAAGSAAIPHDGSGIPRTGAAAAAAAAAAADGCAASATSSGSDGSASGGAGVAHANTVPAAIGAPEVEDEPEDDEYADEDGWINVVQAEDAASMSARRRSAGEKQVALQDMRNGRQHVAAMCKHLSSFFPAEAAAQFLRSVAARPRALLAALLDTSTRAALHAAALADPFAGAASGSNSKGGTASVFATVDRIAIGHKHNIPDAAVAAMVVTSRISPTLAVAVLLASACELKSYRGGLEVGGAGAAAISVSHQFLVSAEAVAAIERLKHVPRAYLACHLREVAHCELARISAEFIATQPGGLPILPDAVEALDALRRANASYTTLTSRGAAVVAALDVAMPTLQSLTLSASAVVLPPPRSECLLRLAPSCSSLDLQLPALLTIVDAPGAVQLQITQKLRTPGLSDGNLERCSRSIWVTSPAAAAKLLHEARLHAPARVVRGVAANFDCDHPPPMQFIFCDTSEPSSSADSAAGAACEADCGRDHISIARDAETRFAAAVRALEAAQPASTWWPLPTVTSFVLSSAEASELAARVRAQLVAAPLLAAVGTAPERVTAAPFYKSAYQLSGWHLRVSRRKCALEPEAHYRALHCESDHEADAGSDVSEVGGGSDVSDCVYDSDKHREPLAVGGAGAPSGAIAVPPATWCKSR